MDTLDLMRPDAAGVSVAISTASLTPRNDAPDMTPEEHKRCGDAADALFREIKRRIAEKDWT